MTAEAPKSCHLQLGLSVLSGQLADLLIGVSNARGPHYSCRARRCWRISLSLSQDADAAPPPAKLRSAAHLPFHHSQPFTPDLFLQRCYFKPHVERCQRVPVSVPSSLCVPMRQMLISRSRARSCRFSRSLLLTEAVCVFVAVRLCLLAFLCAGIALPLYSYIDAAVCSSLVLSVSLLFTDC